MAPKADKGKRTAELAKVTGLQAADYLEKGTLVLDAAQTRTQRGDKT